MSYDTLFPHVDMMEIQSNNLNLNQERHESSLLFSQAEPFQSSSMSFAMESMEFEPEVPVDEIIPSIEAVNWQSKGYTIQCNEFPDN